MRCTRSGPSSELRRWTRAKQGPPPPWESNSPPQVTSEQATQEVIFAKHGVVPGLQSSASGTGAAAPEPNPRSCTTASATTPRPEARTDRGSFGTHLPRRRAAPPGSGFLRPWGPEVTLLSNQLARFRPSALLGLADPGCWALLAFCPNPVVWSWRERPAEVKARLPRFSKALYHSPFQQTFIHVYRRLNFFF